MRAFAVVLLSLLLLAVAGTVIWLRSPGSSPAPAPKPEERDERASLDLAIEDPVLALEWPAEIAPEFDRVVLMSIDTLRADHLPMYGYPRNTAPFLNELSTRSVLFEKAFASISHTAPSHATMLTGMPPILHGVQKNGDKLDAELPSLASIFGRAGFETAAYLSVGFLQGVAVGFDHAVTSSKPDVFVDDVVRWLQEGRTSERFFLWLHIYKPHQWMYWKQVDRKRLRTLWKDQGPQGDEFFDYIADLHQLRLAPEGEEFEVEWTGSTGTGTNLQPTSPGELTRFIDAYDALIHETDDDVRRIYEALEAQNLPGRTLWIVTSDHGEGLGEHGYAGHGAHIYGEQLNVPLLLHATDGSLGPRRVSQPVGHTDLLPTLAGQLGAGVRSVIPRVLGRSLEPLLEGKDDDWTERVLFSQRKKPRDPAVKNELFAVQSESAKLFWHRDQGEYEFYDLTRDPEEARDESEGKSAAQQKLLRHLNAQLLLFQRLGPGASDEPIPESWLEELGDLGYTD